jgi:NAD(P)-dependent dehydrogenase (short-subunit alcohol dehydrogenase family)
MKRFEGKVALVTGGARNTGLEIVDLFLREGAKVFFCGSSDASVAEGVKALESRGLAGFRGVKCDVSLRSDVEAMMDVIEREAGRLDVVVSNAANFGLGQGTCLETTDDQFLSVLQVNVLGGFRLVQLAANRFFMRQEPNPATGQRGVVVFVGSNSSERVSRNRITYVSSKGAMDSMMKSFAVDLAPKGIRVNMVAPGFIWTSRWQFLSDEIKTQRRSLVPNGREATGKDVADAVLYFASDDARGFQGARVVMDGGSSVQLYPACCEDDTSKMREK